MVCQYGGFYRYPFGAWVRFGLNYAYSIVGGWSGARARRLRVLVYFVIGLFQLQRMADQKLTVHR